MKKICLSFVIITSALLAGCNLSWIQPATDVAYMYDQNPQIVEVLRGLDIPEEDKAKLGDALNTLESERAKYDVLLTTTTMGSIPIGAFESSYVRAKTAYITARDILIQYENQVPVDTMTGLKGINTLVVEYDDQIEDAITRTEVLSYLGTVAKLLTIIG